MTTVTAIFGSNLVNRYGFIMPIPVLESSLDQAWDNPRPSSIGHDLHRASGWTKVIALHLQPGLARLFGAVHYAENAEEMNVVQNVLDASVSRQIAELDAASVSDLKAKLAGKLSGSERLHAQGCTAIFDQGVARRAFPSIFTQADKDGLIPVSALNYIAPGVFEKDGLLLFAHQYFRRSLSRHNTLNDPFLERLHTVSKTSSLDVRIALDGDLVGHPATLLKNIELQYWWGPKFSDALGEIRPGVTRHEANESERFFNAIAATEFWWYEQDERKTFECEELRDLNVPSMGKSATEFGCRFVHSILERNSDQSIHLDGAVRVYSEELMLERVEKGIMKFGRRADYRKLWRVDGNLRVNDWKALINDYYRDNHLVGEYFGGKQEGEEALRPTTIMIDEGCSIHEFAPCTMARDDGVRIAISYHPKSTNTSPRAIVPIERFSPDGCAWTNYVEACAVEFMKLIKRRGETVEIPDGTAIVAFEDMVTNLPLIEHPGSDSSLRAQVTLEAIREYCFALCNRGHDRMIAFHISVHFEDRDAHFSFAGHVDDMAIWLQSQEAHLPETARDVGNWAEAACNFLTARFQTARDVPSLANMIKMSGLLTVDRKYLEPGEFVIQPSRRHPPVISLVNCPSIQKAMPLVKEKRLVATTAFILKGSACEMCHGSYAECPCIRIVDVDVSQSITDAEMFGVFWTDRSAWNTAIVAESPDDPKPIMD